MTPSFLLRQIKIEIIVKIFTYCIGFLSYIAVAAHIGTIYAILFLALIVLSIYFEYHRISIPRWVLTSASFLTILYFISRFNLGDFATQMVEALLMLLAIKFLERKQVRDYMQIYAISLFLFAGTGLLAFSIIFLVYILIFVFFLSLSFVFLTYYAQEPEMEFTPTVTKKIVIKCVWIPVLAIPLSVVMFFILPRSQYPLLDFLNRADKAKTGFTDKVLLGKVADIQEDSSIIFRANMKKIGENNLYWRGITLGFFDGTSWGMLPAKSSLAQNLPTHFPAGKTVKQVIYLEPYNNTYLFCLDKPFAVIHKNVRKYDDLTYTVPSSLNRRIRYEVSSIISDTIEKENIDAKSFLQTPESLPERIVALVGSLTTRHKKPEEKAAQIFAYLHNGEYRYSMRGLPLSKNPLEAFLFQTKSGNCEYFASSLAVMLRIARIPSRLVGGYRGGYYNEVGQYYIVPQKNAHVWVEAFLPERGWLRLDPTPASTDIFSPSLKGQTFLRISLLMDTINYYWYSIVINYNLEKQISIGQQLIRGWKKPSFSVKPTKNQLLFILAAIILVVPTITGIRSFIRSKRTSEEKKLIVLFQKKMERKGYKRRIGEGLEEFIHSIRNDTDRKVSLDFAEEIEKMYYKDKRFTVKKLRQLRTLLRKI